MKLWEKGINLDKAVEQFTIGKDNDMDMFLAKYDIEASLAHITMLAKINLLTEEEFNDLMCGLKEIGRRIQEKKFMIDPGMEDVHSQIELELTKKYGETGKKIHAGRSRNDQVLTAMKLFIRTELENIKNEVTDLFDFLIGKSEFHKDDLMPGYTHLQPAMPSSFGLWFGAYAESLCDDMQLLLTAYIINNQNPLGSAAGYGSSFPVDREITTKILGFDQMNINSLYAQMTRGKNEQITAFAIANIASTLSRLASDICLFTSQEFGFITISDAFTTGSSIMPHKKNPDVFELIRARSNRIRSLPNEISLINTNLTSGYFRDMQIIKEIFIPVLADISDCVKIMHKALENIQLKKNIVDKPLYENIFSVESVNRAVLKGDPFREAYKKISDEVFEGSFKTDKKIKHTHIGSIGNLCNIEIKKRMLKILASF